MLRSHLPFHFRNPLLFLTPSPTLPFSNCDLTLRCSLIRKRCSFGERTLRRNHTKRCTSMGRCRNWVVPIRASSSSHENIARSNGDVASRNKGSRSFKYQVPEILRGVSSVNKDTGAVEFVDENDMPGKAKLMGSRFVAAEYEEALYKWWEQSGFFSPGYGDVVDSRNTGKGERREEEKPFVIMMPPPNVTGSLHMGHAMCVTVEDILARYNRMQYNQDGGRRKVLYLPGTDHAGIATQMLVERAILNNEGLRKEDLGREGFLERVWKWKNEKGGYIGQQTRRLGASCDWERERFTLDEGCCRAVSRAFVKFWEEGLIYKGEYMVNWAPGLGTAVSDLEVEMKEEEGTMYYFKYPVKGGGYIPVATTRPETILGDTAVCVHPEDARYKDFVGKTCFVPLVNREVPIISDEYVDRELGTGALKITPGHDVNDYEIGKRHDLPIISIFNKDASISDGVYKPYTGVDRFEARKRIWEDLEKDGLVIKKDSYLMRVPRSQRGGELIEPMISTQWFMRMDSLAKPALEAVKSGEVKIVPERFTKVYVNWLENIKDWCISRQLWWGHRIPVYYVSGANEEEYIVAESREAAEQMAKEKHGPEATLMQDEDVLDTWFSSGLWPFSTLGWGQGEPEKDSKDLDQYYPGTVLETGYDILFFWVARMIMMGTKLMGKPPFSVVYLHGLVRDGQGRKMSKTTGNVIDPVDIISTYGADALRYSLMTGSTPGQDIPLSIEKVESNRNFATKMWNICRFVLGNIGELSEEERRELASLQQSEFGTTISHMPLAERYILSRLHLLVDRVTSSFQRYDFGDAGRQVHDFLWDEFADWYVEVSKPRLWSWTNGDGAGVNDQDRQTLMETRRTLVYVLDTCLRLLHPFMPYVTEVLWHRLPRDYNEQQALIVGSWARGGGVDESAIDRFSRLQALIRAVRNVRADYQVASTTRLPLVVHSDQLTCEDVMSNHKMLSLLCKVDGDSVTTEVRESNADGEDGNMDGTGVNSRDDMVQLIVAEDLTAYVPMQGLIDFEKERARLEKQLGKLEKESAGVQKRLSSPGFMDKAPKNVVEAARSNANELEEKILNLHKKIKELEKVVKE